MRAFWSGEIAFGLVTIPAKLYTATKDSTPQFAQLHKECGSRISMVRRCAKCARDVRWEEIGKGYEVSKGEYALFSKEELAKLEGDEGTGAIEIAEFIDPLEVDLAYLEKSYWVGPGGRNTRGFELLRDALTKSKKVALAKVKLRTRTRLAILRPRDRLFALETMRFAEELVPGDEIALGESSKKTSSKELELALALIHERSESFDPTKHPDSYRAAFDQALQQKIEEGDVSRDESSGAEAAVAEGGAVIDLADLLAKSLRTMGSTGRKAPPANDSVPPAKGSVRKVGAKKGEGRSAKDKKRSAG